VYGHLILFSQGKLLFHFGGEGNNSRNEHKPTQLYTTITACCVHFNVAF